MKNKGYSHILKSYYTFLINVLNQIKYQDIDPADPFLLGANSKINFGESPFSAR